MAKLKGERVSHRELKRAQKRARDGRSEKISEKRAGRTDEEKTKENRQRREVKPAIWGRLCALPPHITGQRLMNEWKSIPIIELTRAVGVITVKWRGRAGRLK